MERGILLAVGLWLLAVNGLAFAAFGRDKRLAQRGERRIPEFRLLLYAALGGALGAWIGMRHFHHKTRKPLFRLLVPLLLLLHLALAGAAVWIRLHGIVQF